MLSSAMHVAKPMQAVTVLPSPFPTKRCPGQKSLLKSCFYIFACKGWVSELSLGLAISSQVTSYIS
ncbi:hypothetical protein B0H34DRAFT_730901 [Crassisporium funariophilum]|nr:hypothetical protein B0H34DRAFT_730901 [Crassisporium funariophilum]